MIPTVSARQRSRRQPRSRGVLATLAAASLTIAACAGSDDAEETPTATEAETRAVSTGEAPEATDAPETTATPEITEAPDTTSAPETTAAPATTAAATTTTEPEPVCPAAVPNETPQPAGIVASFDRTAFEIAEGVAVDKSGNVYVSLPPLGQIVRFAPGSSEYEVFATVPDWDLAPEEYFIDHFGILGLALDAEGHVYAAVESAGRAGVWKFDCRTGEGTRFEGTENAFINDGLALDADGRVYVTDVITNGIVRVDPDGTITSIAGGPEAGFDSPTSMAFGVGATGLTMYAVNLAGGSYEPNEFPGPALVAIDVDTPGMPLP